MEVVLGILFMNKNIYFVGEIMVHPLKINSTIN